jgi:DNA-binding winged helix-turn-helix (wHTH) protein
MKIRFGYCLFDGDARELVVRGKPVHVTPKAFQLLEMLLEERPKAVSKESIHARLWPSTFVSDGTLTSLLAEVRAAIGDDGHHPHLLRTVHGFGYAFSGEAAEDSERSRSSDGSTCRLLWGDREIALVPGDNILGREQDCVVWIDDDAVSRHHARIVIDRRGAEVEDLASKNGTFLRGERITLPARLRDGDLLRIGSATFVFRTFDPPGSTVTATRARESGPP